MLKILTIIGARPQIIKAAALSRAIKNKYQNRIREVIIHTGQHYDENMSQVFFDELNIPSPDYNLNVGSGSHGKQTAAMISGIEELIRKEQPHCIVLYGDTNSTLAGGIAACKIHLPIIHIEAGLRSYNKEMPEEVNRILCDHISTLLFSPTLTGVKNLTKEGFKTLNSPPYHINNPKIYHCGDIMYDNTLYFSKLADTKADLLTQLNLTTEPFVLATIHRNHNTDNPDRLSALFRALDTIATANNIQIVLPLHPRTAKLLSENLTSVLYQQIMSNNLIKIIGPASFLEMTLLEKHAQLIITDSGGVQKEAFFFKKPCIILRAETEWIELVACGAAVIADADELAIVNAYTMFKQKNDLVFEPLFGDGQAAEFICGELLNHIPHNQN